MKLKPALKPREIQHPVSSEETFVETQNDDSDLFFSDVENEYEHLISMLEDAHNASEGQNIGRYKQALVFLETSLLWFQSADDR